ncbi:MAG TPA: hypothetical protein VGE04_19225 [Chloroflexia bacterium]|jgi:hypothetical protein
MKIVKPFRVLLASVLLLSILPGATMNAAASPAEVTASSAFCDTVYANGYIKTPRYNAVIRRGVGTEISGVVKNPDYGCFAIQLLVNGTTREHLKVRYYPNYDGTTTWSVWWPAASTSASLGLRNHKIEVRLLMYGRTELLTLEGTTYTSIPVLVVP